MSTARPGARRSHRRARHCTGRRHRHASPLGAGLGEGLGPGKTIPEALPSSRARATTRTAARAALMGILPALAKGTVLC